MGSSQHAISWWYSSSSSLCSCCMAGRFVATTKLYKSLLSW
jgi:hypothetical protein